MTVNIPVVSEACRDRVRRVPRPLPPMTNSPTTAPVIASAAPARMPARIDGAAMGSSMCQSRCHGPAPSSIPASRARMSRRRNPMMVVVTIGKNATIAHRTAIGTAP